MRINMSQSFKTFMTVCVMSITSVSAQEIEIGRLACKDVNGTAITGLVTTTTEKSLLIVTDAGRPLTQVLLSKIKAAKLDWKNRLLIIVSGTPADLKAVMNAFAITGGRWCVATPGTAPPVFKLSVTPFVVGLNPGGATAWKVVGEPEITHNNLSPLRGWSSPVTLTP
jgi:hypothetical protein